MKMGRRERGSVLLIALFILTLLLMIGASALSGSMVELRVSGITKRTMDGFQKAEAGVGGTLALVGTADDPFTGASKPDVFGELKAVGNPVADVSDIAVSSEIAHAGVSCVRNPSGFSANKVACDYYEVSSVHQEPNTGIATQVVYGVRKEVIAY